MRNTKAGDAEAAKFTVVSSIFRSHSGDEVLFETEVLEPVLADIQHKASDMAKSASIEDYLLDVRRQPCAACSFDWLGLWCCRLFTARSPRSVLVELDHHAGIVMAQVAKVIRNVNKRWSRLLRDTTWSSSLVRQFVPRVVHVALTSQAERLIRVRMVTFPLPL